MPILRSPIWPDPRVKPPFGSVDLNRAHPLGGALGAYFLIHEGAGVPINLVAPYRVGVPGASKPTWVPSQERQALNFVAASNQYVDYTGTTGLKNTNFSLVARIRIPTTSDKGGVLYITTDDGGNLGFGLGTGDFDTNGNNLIVLVEGVAWNPSTAPAGTGWHTIAFSVPPSGTNRYFYVDGTLVATITGTAVSGGGSPRLTLGRSSDSSGRAWTGDMAWAAYFKRQLTDGEMFAIHAEPYAHLLRPILSRRYFVAAGAPVDTSLIYRSKSFDHMLVR